jgi:hypothetical protein
MMEQPGVYWSIPEQPEVSRSSRSTKEKAFPTCMEQPGVSCSSLTGSHLEHLDNSNSTGRRTENVHVLRVVCNKQASTFQCEEF